MHFIAEEIEIQGIKSPKSSWLSNGARFLTQVLLLPKLKLLARLALKGAIQTLEMCVLHEPQPSANDTVVKQLKRTGHPRLEVHPASTS